MRTVSTARTGVRFAEVEEPGDNRHGIKGADLSGILMAARSPTRSARWPASTRRAATAGKVDTPMDEAEAASLAASAALWASFAAASAFFYAAIRSRASEAAWEALAAHLRAASASQRPPRSPPSPWRSPTATSPTGPCRRRGRRPAAPPHGTPGPPPGRAACPRAASAGRRAPRRPWRSACRPASARPRRASAFALRGRGDSPARCGRRAAPAALPRPPGRQAAPGGPSRPRTGRQDGPSGARPGILSCKSRRRFCTTKCDSCCPRSAVF